MAEKIAQIESDIDWPVSTHCGHWKIGWAMLFCPAFRGNSFNTAWAQKACPPWLSLLILDNKIEATFY